MKVGGGGLESFATQELVSNIVKAEKSEPKERKMDTNANDASDIPNSSLSKVNRDDLIKATENVNKAFQPFNQGLHFRVNDETKQLVVQIVNQETNEVIKEIPSKELLELEARLREMVGLFLDEKA